MFFPYEKSVYWLMMGAAYLLAVSTIYTGYASFGSYTLPVSALPAIPAAYVQHETPLSISLFSEPDAWTPYTVGEMSPDDEAIFYSPESKLPLKVVGIVRQRDSKKDLAIIDSASSQFTVSVSDIVQEHSSRIIRIFNDRVIISHQGLYQSLIMTQEGAFLP
ncbi:type II secretion system protein N [Pantoea endophytica]|uniref:Type II secretion system protein N n=1 Tax=Pantoea sp. BJ2 TaxID=3141322 RepID=A0AAU7U3D7_9GAMM